jgi:predicted NBD/HSP70 family sugar kinase
MKIHTIGIDLGKTKFHIVGLNERGEVVVRKQFSRGTAVINQMRGLLLERGITVRKVCAHRRRPVVRTDQNRVRTQAEFRRR